jgi:hypothetical protein
MNKLLKEWIVEVLTAALMVASMWVNVSCEKGTEPDRTKCGSGNVYLDSKTGLCKDRADGSVVPRECCP